MVILEAGQTLPIALTPCKGEACHQWEPGPVKYCVHMIRVNNRGRQKKGFSKFRDANFLTTKTALLTKIA